MLDFINFKTITTSLLSASFVGLFATIAPAEPTGNIAPSNFYTEDGIGQTITLDRTVTVELDSLVETITTTTTGAPQKVDILFLADNTGSMGNAIANVKTNAQSLLNQLSAAYNDVQFGVARYYGAPKEYGNYSYDSVPGETYNGAVIGTTTETDTFTKTWKYWTWTYWRGNYWYKYKIVTRDSDGNWVDTDWEWSKSWLDGHSVTWTAEETINVYESIPVEMDSYELQEAMGATDAEAIAAIQDWHASGGKDWEEANFFALHQAATSGAETDLGWQTGYDTNWRDGAMKIIVWFGDAPSHTSDTTEAETIAALTTNNVYVVAVDVGSIDYDSQASNITTATSGAYASSADNQVATTMQTLIGTAVSNYTVTTTTTTNPTVNLDFRTSADTPLPAGVVVTYSCTDPLGCNNVANGETRTFEMTVVGVAGEYDFDTVAFDVDTDTNVPGAIADNLIQIHNID